MMALNTLLYFLGLIASTTQRSKYNSCGTLCSTCNSKTYDCISCASGAIPISAAACTCQENWVEIQYDQCVQKGSAGYYIYFGVCILLLLLVVGVISWGIFAICKCIRNKTGYRLSDWIWRKRMLGRQLAPIEVDVPRKVDNYKEELGVERDSVSIDQRTKESARESLEVELIKDQR